MRISDLTAKAQRTQRKNPVKHKYMNGHNNVSASPACEFLVIAVFARFASLR
jgi:hypothetical protein